MTEWAKSRTVETVNDFERELGEAFSEVSDEGMPISFTLGNDEHTGVISSPTSDVHLREPGYEGVDQIVVMVPRVKLSRNPEEYVRQILQVTSGPQIGKWVVQAVNPDLAHYAITCVPST